MSDLPDASDLTPEQLETLAAAGVDDVEQMLKELLDHRRYNALDFWTPYPKQQEFFEAGKKYNERLLIAGSRMGKSDTGAAETACHLTGLYPKWWRGRRFERPVTAWASGVSTTVVRNVSQSKLCGRYGDTAALGSGFIPKRCFADKPTLARGAVADAYDTVKVFHWNRFGIRDGISTLQFKCHPAQSRVLMADGSWRRISEVGLADCVRTSDGASRQVTQLHAYHEAPTLRIVTRSGELQATPNHPIFTDRGKLNASMVKCGDVLECAYGEPDGEAQEKWRVVLTALMIGDGRTRGKTPFFSCNEPDTVKAVAGLLPDDMAIRPLANTISYKISSSLHKRNRLTESLRADGLWSLKSKYKFIPPWVFCLPRSQRILFLHWLWNCDGTVNSEAARYSSASGRLIQDVRLLLWSVGIFAPYRTHEVGNGSGRRFQAYYLALYGEQRRQFIEIGKIGRDNTYARQPRPRGAPGEVVAIEMLPPQKVYCVGVDDVHELVVDGYRVGNSYEQGREKFQGDSIDFHWWDEEPPDENLYVEGNARWLDSRGMGFVTFTSLKGKTTMVARFTDNITPFRKMIVMRAADVPHATADLIAELKGMYPRDQWEARINGEILLGSGRVFLTPEEQIAFPLSLHVPEHWALLWGIDFGTDHPFAAVLSAWDKDLDILYILNTYRAANGLPLVHAEALRRIGANVPVAWPHDGHVGKAIGAPHADIYKTLGLKMLPTHASYPDGSNSTEAALLEMEQRLADGRLRVREDLADWFGEYRMYHRDENHLLVKKSDDLMSATQKVMMAKRYARPVPLGWTARPQKRQPGERTMRTPRFNPWTGEAEPIQEQSLPMAGPFWR